MPMTIRRHLCAATLLAAALSPSAWAHGFKAGDLAVDHPYATPTRPGKTTGAVYFRAIKNNGTEPDRLLSARTPAAARRVAAQRWRRMVMGMGYRGMKGFIRPSGCGHVWQWHGWRRPCRRTSRSEIPPPAGEPCPGCRRCRAERGRIPGRAARFWRRPGCATR